MNRALFLHVRSHVTTKPMHSYDTQRKIYHSRRLKHRLGRRNIGEQFLAENTLDFLSWAQMKITTVAQNRGQQEDRDTKTCIEHFTIALIPSGPGLDEVARLAAPRGPDMLFFLPCQEKYRS